jgi:hypothetical protein
MAPKRADEERCGLIARGMPKQNFWGYFNIITFFKTTKRSLTDSGGYSLLY